MRGNKELYRELCKSGEIPILFNQDWWLDEVCYQGKWDAIIVKDHDHIIAAMPYYYKKKGIFKIITMPKLTPTLSPYIFYPDSMKYNKKLSFEKKIFKEIIHQLPKYDYFCQSFGYDIINWLPFYWEGFKQKTYYSYYIDLARDLAEIYGDFENNMKNKVNKASKIVSLGVGMDIKRFYQLNSMVFARQNQRVPYSFHLIKKIDDALIKRKQREILYAVDDQNNIHSALYLVWDGVSCYLHLVGEDPRLRTSGAGIFLIWEAIKYAKNVLKLKLFDFEGSMIENIEIVRRSCAGKQLPYFVLEKNNSLLLEIALRLRR